MYHITNIGGIDYKLHLTFNALAEFKVLNNGIGFVAFADGKADIDFPEMRVLFHVALKAGSKDYEKSVEETGDLLQSFIEEKGFAELEKELLKMVEQLKGKKKQPQDHLPKQV
jgi:hypothetical protein